MDHRQEDIGLYHGCWLDYIFFVASFHRHVLPAMGFIFPTLCYPLHVFICHCLRCRPAFFTLALLRDRVALLLLFLIDNPKPHVRYFFGTPSQLSFTIPLCAHPRKPIPRGPLVPPRTLPFGGRMPHCIHSWSWFAGYLPMPVVHVYCPSP